MARTSFDVQLAKLQDDLLTMSQAVDAAIERSLSALVNRDVASAQEIIDQDKALNHMQRDIEEKCLVLIATQQPIASDLRVILAISSIAGELERIGDHAEGIAKITLLLGDQPPVKPLIDIPRMAAKCREMLREQMQAFMSRDRERARHWAEKDEEVDDLYDQIFRELLVFMMDDPRTITRATYLLWVAHNLERIADRTTNIGERLLYLVTGQVEDLNP